MADDTKLVDEKGMLTEAGWAAVGWTGKDGDGFRTNPDFPGKMLISADRSLKGLIAFVHNSAYHEGQRAKAHLIRSVLDIRDPA